MPTESLIISSERIVSKIYIIRNKKVMLDRDLADLYGVTTGNFNLAVRRNIKRFPEDFMFQMSKEEMKNWKLQFATSNSIKMGLRNQRTFSHKWCPAKKNNATRKEICKSWCQNKKDLWYTRALISRRKWFKKRNWI